ncbi:MAG: DUF222 domain-containing protein [Dermatophilus congolensis]|nr:DUF222 domain-containing protein [Dermatophilus congolensis]
MTDTTTRDPRTAGADACGQAVDPAPFWGRCASDSDPDYWAPAPDDAAELDTTPVSATGADVLRQLVAVRQILTQLPGQLASVYSPDLARLVTEASGVVAAAEAARAALVLDAHGRGVIASSDNPRVDRYVEQAHRDAGAPVSARQAATLKDIANVCDSPDVAPLREAVTCGRISIDTAAMAARFYRRIRPAVGPITWEPVLETIIDAVAGGATARQLDSYAQVIIGQYADPDSLCGLDAEHEAAHSLRDMTSFRRDRHGMLTATVRLDPAGEAAVTAAITAMATPAPAADGTPDPRTPGQRRADALVTLAGLATRYDDDTVGVGPKAKIYVTISHDTLRTHLDSAGIDPATGPRGVGVTEHGQVLTPAEARMLACDAGIIPIVLGSAGEVLDVGREKRLATPAQRAALVARDKHCSFPGCDAPPSWCEAHHLREWDDGGPTDLLNLALLCRHHHRETHMKGHIGTATARGVTWSRHDGTSIGNTPRPERCR